MPKIKLFTHEGCANCKKVKSMIETILPELGLNYGSAIIELDIDDPDALADLMMLDTEYVPTMNAGDSVLTGKDILNQSLLRGFIEAQTADIEEKP
jgi:glutaredoxin